jgi:hypothetical protein
LLRSVNRKTDVKNAIVSGSLPYYGWTNESGAGLLRDVLSSESAQM